MPSLKAALRRSYQVAQKDVFFAERYSEGPFDMMKIETAPRIDNLIAEMCELSETEQRSLAGAVLENRRLEAFVEELDDHLSCEKAATEGSGEPFTGI